MLIGTSSGLGRFDAAHYEGPAQPPISMVLAARRLTGRLAMLERSDPPVIGPYFDMPSELIGGGTPEIQLTIIASMILGLPRK